MNTSSTVKSFVFSYFKILSSYFLLTFLILSLTIQSSLAEYSLGRFYKKKEILCEFNKKDQIIAYVSNKGKLQTLTKFQKSLIRKKRKKSNKNLRKFIKRLKKAKKKFNKLCRDNEPTDDPTQDPDQPTDDCSLTVEDQTLNVLKNQTINIEVSASEDCSENLVFKLIDSPSHGVTNINNNIISFTAANYPQTYAINYQATAGEKLSNIGNIKIQVLGQTHEVEVRDHIFVPKDLTILEGDSVNWIWIDDFHDVQAGIAPNVSSTYDNAFVTAIESAGFSYNFAFNRSLLTNFPVVSDLYQYFCNPHFHMDMTGTVQVLRQANAFFTNLNSREINSSSSSSLNMECLLELNAAEDLLSFNCSSNNYNPTSATLFQGAFGSTGTKICDLDVNPNSLSGTCILSSGQRDSLWAGNTYIQAESASGSLRGQIVVAGGYNQLSGRVVSSGSEDLSEITISDGTRSTKTDFSGKFKLDGVPNGLFFLSASKQGCVINPEVGTSPTLVNGRNVVFRDFNLINCD